jgi:hypothetical protein
MTGGQVGDTTVNEANVTDTGVLMWSGGSFYAPTSQATQPVLTQTGSGTAFIQSPGGTLTHWTLKPSTSLGVANGYFYEGQGGMVVANAGMSMAAGSAIYNNTNPGGVTIPSGQSLVETGSGTAVNFNVPVTNSGTITSSGPGMIFNALTNSGKLDLGTSTVTIQSAYAPTSGSSTDVTIAGQTSGSTYGDLVVQGAFTIAGTLNITTPGSFTPASGSIFTIATYNSHTGSFGSVHQTGTATYSGPTYGATAATITAN